MLAGKNQLTWMIAIYNLYMQLQHHKLVMGFMILLTKFNFCYQFANCLGTGDIAIQKRQPVQGDYL